MTLEVKQSRAAFEAGSTVRLPPACVYRRHVKRVVALDVALSHTPYWSRFIPIVAPISTSHGVLARRCRSEGGGLRRMEDSQGLKEYCLVPSLGALSGNCPLGELAEFQPAYLCRLIPTAPKDQARRRVRKSISSRGLRLPLSRTGRPWAAQCCCHAGTPCAYERICRKKPSGFARGRNIVN